MRRLLFAFLILLAPVAACAVPWEFDNNVTIRGNLIVDGGVSFPPGTISLDNVTLNLNNFPADLRPVKVVAALPACTSTDYPEGAVVYLNSDYKLYRCLSIGNWTSLIESTDLNGYLQPSVFADNIITNNMIAGSISAAKLAVDHLSAVNTELGTIQQGYIAPGDDNTTTGAGLKITGGNIEAYGGTQTFGGTVVSSDGNYLTSIGKGLTVTGKTKRYPINNVTNYSADGQIHVYKWSSGWIEVVELGQLGTSDFWSLRVTSPSDSGVHGAKFTGGGNGSYALEAINTNTSGGGGGINTYLYASPTVDNVNGFKISINGSTDNGIGIGGGSTNGYGGGFAGGIGPVYLEASGSAAAPNHEARKGTLWVTSDGVLYINTNGSTTWAKVGAQE